VVLEKDNATYIILYLVCVGALFISFAVGGDDWSKTFAEKFRTLKAEDGVFMSVTPLLVLMLSYIASIEVKASLPYLRWKHALPGHRVFSLYRKNDSRLGGTEHQAALARALAEHWGITLSNYEAKDATPDEQNHKWYMLYLNYSARPDVYMVHQHFLLLCDIAWMSLLSGVVGAIALGLSVGWKAALTYLGILVVIILVTSLGARNAGIRFVKSVLVATLVDHEQRAKSQ
jgi:hypothetical protein